ncbi:hypothetical protein [Photobacterium damselae]|uniref:hypothetical protein n=1 Tax=Photobacterium damselae TaxID=38293 RepID=UPI004067B05B
MSNLNTAQTMEVEDKMKEQKSTMPKEEKQKKAVATPQIKSPIKNIKNPRDLAQALAKLHKQGQITLGQRALITVATVLDKRATDGQVRTMVKEAQKYGIKLAFRPNCLR